MPVTIEKYSGLFRKMGATIGLLGLHLCLLITWSCIEETDFVEGCPTPREAEAVSIKEVFYSPYKNQRYANSSDTVNFSEFGFNFELEIQELEALNSSSFPGQAFALSCIQTYNLRNISNISVVLTAPFAGLPVGTDISYLLITPDGEKISELRDFRNVSVYFGTKLNLSPSNYSQLKTRTFLFLRNGTQKVLDSISPYLKTN
jgi:hypothetical protein